MEYQAHADVTREPLSWVDPGNLSSGWFSMGGGVNIVRSVHELKRERTCLWVSRTN